MALTLSQTVIKNCEKYLGYKENPPNSNRNFFGAFLKNDGVPWCGAFVSCMYIFSGSPLNTEYKWGFLYCPTGAVKMKNKGWLIPSTEAQPGDIVFYNWKGNKSLSMSEHTGIVSSKVKNNYFTAYEGNTSLSDNSNGGEVMNRSRSLNSVTGIFRPKLDITPVKISKAPPYNNVIYILTSPVKVSEHVKTFQNQLLKLGYKINTDGAFNKTTYDALKKFQKDKGLVVDGALGPMSWNAAWN